MMKVEMHILQNFAPSCLNRDDVNAPKDCEFGGVRRARISSQCLKRSIRTYWTKMGLLEGNRAKRTRLLVRSIIDSLISEGRTREDAQGVVEAVVTQALNLGLNKDGTTQYLFLLGTTAVEGLKDAIQENWDCLHEAFKRSAPSEGTRKKKSDPGSLPPNVIKAMEVIFDGANSADLGLFGRMVADKPIQNIEAACQVAHAISTHRVSTEVDYYTTVDDLQPHEETGAGMIGTVEFNSACFYRYALVDYDQLVKNLAGDKNLAISTIEAFITASVKAIPTGKQNSMAAHNLPSFVLIVVRDKGIPWSLANAYETPVYPRQGEGGLVIQSIRQIDDYWGRLCNIYGTDDIKDYSTVCVEDVEFEHLGASRVENLSQLSGRIIAVLEEYA